MIEFGFSYIGCLFLLMLFVPNIIWSRNQPSDYEKYAKNENKILLIFERLGEALTSALAVIFKTNNIRMGSVWLIWLVAAFVFMFIYEIYWIRYFKSSKTMKDMYKSCMGIKVAGATCPVIAFFLLGIYGTNIFLILSTIILGIGHIGIHLTHEKEAYGKAIKPGKIRIAVRIIAALLMLPIVAVIAVRNFIWITDPSTIREDLYIDINGQEQYINIRGTDSNNPVILYLHGGPGSPDACMSYVFADYLIDDYTFVCWDQRGCGRTYIHNDDKDNSTVSFDMALSDTEVLVSYLKERFAQDKIIIMGHSYGSVLGATYAYTHPEDCEAFIGIGLFVNTMASSAAEYEAAYNIAQAKGDDTSFMTECYNRMISNNSFEESMELSRCTSPYLQAENESNTILSAILSPYMTSDDFIWTSKILSFEDFMRYEGSLMDYLNSIDLRVDQPSYEVPVLFISGGADYNCTYTVAEEYGASCGAQVYIIEGADHYCHAACPEEFAAAVKDFLREE